MDNKSIIGRNISFIRNLNNLTQDKVADYLKMNRSTYSNYEASLREPDVDVLLKLSSLFGCELSCFFEEDENNLKDFMVCQFRADNLSNDDLKSIARFNDIVMSYTKIEKLLSNE